MNISELPAYMLANYYFVDRIGEGAYGKVYKVLSLKDKRFYALKIIDLNMKEAFENEVKAHRILSENQPPGSGCREEVVCMFYYGFYDPLKAPPNFIERAKRTLTNLDYLGLGDDLDLYPKKTYYLVQELMDGDLEQIIDYNSKINFLVSPDIILLVMHRLLKAVAYIHSLGIIHHDIKPQNILYLNERSRSLSMETLLRNPQEFKEFVTLRLGDLGLACSLNDQLEKCKNQGTLAYIAPEFAFFSDFQEDHRMSGVTSQKGDLWALGITFWEFIFMDHPLYPKAEDFDQIEAGEIIQRLGEIFDKSFRDVFPGEYIGNDDEKSIAINVVLESLLEPNLENRAEAGELAFYLEDNFPTLLL